MLNLFREVFIVGYNDGLQGARKFHTYVEAYAEAKDATTIAPNITIRDKRGNLLNQFT
jgi:hypothetical protein